MTPSSVGIALWYGSFLLECVVCFLALWRRLYSRLIIFPLYLGMLVAREVFVYWVYHVYGYSSRSAFFAYWITQGILLLLRAGSIAEIIWKASRDYPGFRSIASWLVAVVCAVLLGRACWIVAHDLATVPNIILGIEHQVELTASVVLLLLFVLWIYYDVPLGRPEKLIAGGLLAYSLVQEVNDAILRHWLGPYFYWGDHIRVVSFMAVVGVWIAALGKPLPPPIIPEPPLPPSEMDEYMRQGNALLEALYRDLRRFRKTWKS
jgi:hypothetical protein